MYGITQETDRLLAEGFDLGQAIAIAIEHTIGRACGHKYDCDCVTIKAELAAQD